MVVLLQLFDGADMSLSENLQNLRKERGLRQEQLAELSGVSLTQISKIERNETDPRVSTIEKLARALDCSTDQLLFNEANEGLTGLLKRAFERASKLEPQDKAALLKVIHMACAGGTMLKTMDDFYADAEIEAMKPENRGIDKHLLVGSEIRANDIITQMNDEYHSEIDRLAEKEKTPNSSPKSHPWD